jgi:thiol:disulfide interchange protein DsbD
MAHLSSFISTFLLVACACAQDDAAQPTGESLVRTRVFASVGALHPNESFTIAVAFTVTPEWHIYWRNSGESGMASGISITAPDGFEVGEIQWPIPQVFRGTDVTYGYEGEVLLQVPITAPERLPAGRSSFLVEPEWLVCKSVCYFGSRKHTLSLAQTKPERVVAAAPEDARLLRSWSNRLPIPMRKAREASVRVVRGHLLMSGPAGSARRVWYYPQVTPGVEVDDENPQGPFEGTIVNGRYTFDLLLSIEPESALGEPLRAAGLVVLGRPEPESNKPSTRAFQIGTLIPSNA